MRCGLVVIVTCVLFNSINSKRFETRCKLVRELVKVGLPNHLFLGQWVCLIEKVSNRDTRALTVASNGKKSYGLYQIPSKWCREGKKGGECNIACELLIDDDIRDDTECAVTIFHREGFKYWTQWTNRCKNDNHITNEIYKCPDLISQRSMESPDRTLMPHSEALRVKRRLSRKGMERSRLYSYYGLPWLA
ncbi:lysozyme-like isoform X3 [Maniola hyperantus]|uniref:lysozyme-like isoform X3 n=1 Tax=Aphantopus hyperantus TaxID=2795564 RepID=UPI0015690104|nr:lysozyme-like isoform X1 [Maniola hyperantus]